MEIFKYIVFIVKTEYSLHFLHFFHVFGIETAWGLKNAHVIYLVLYPLRRCPPDSPHSGGLRLLDPLDLGGLRSSYLLVLGSGVSKPLVALLFGYNVSFFNIHK